jgi:hypothetical protein
VASEASLAFRIAKGLETIDRHIQSEYTNDIPTIMGTISAAPRYALLSGQTGQPLLTVLNDRDAVASYYAWTHQSHHEPIATRHPKQVATDWYVFCEALPSQRPVGQSEVVLTNYCLLFPYADDGMVGEIMWKRTSFAERGSFEDRDITVSAPFAADDTRSLRLYEAFTRAADEGDIARLNTLVAAQAEAAVPDQAHADGRLEVLKGGREVIDWFARLGRDAVVTQSISLNTVATSWYVFDERMLVLQVAKQGLFGQATGDVIVVRLAGLYKIDEEGAAIDGIAAIAKIER